MVETNWDWLAGPSVGPEELVKRPTTSVDRVTRVVGSDTPPVVGGLALDSATAEASNTAPVVAELAEAGSVENPWGTTGIRAQEGEQLGLDWGNDNPGGHNWGE